MKRVVYHRLAAAELIESAQFYDERQARLGDEFLTAVDVVLVVIRATLSTKRRANSRRSSGGSSSAMRDKSDESMRQDYRAPGARQANTRPDYGATPVSSVELRTPVGNRE